jgi:hypothetical protein
MLKRQSRMRATRVLYDFAGIGFPHLDRRAPIAATLFSAADSTQGDILGTLRRSGHCAFAYPTGSTGSKQSFMKIASRF